MLRRLRRFVLIVRTTLCVLIAAAFVVSGWWYLGVQLPTRNGPSVGVYGGLFMVHLFHGWDEGWMHAEPVVPLLGGFRPGPIWQMWNEWELGGRGSSRYVFVPIYAVFLAVAIPTMLVWRLGPKRVKLGHCQCGYDLTGNTSGRCPECGRAT